ncbi:MAG: hydrolase [Smithellaceae bacterium]|nr:hydrolase [Smithellaceae bacterium]
MLTAEETILVVVDVQGKLAQVMDDKASLFDNTRRLVQGVHALEIPIIVTEQIPEKLGPTIPEIAAVLPGIRSISKASFSCYGEPAFRKALADLKRRSILIAGIETHVCVYQTVLDLLDAGYKVQVVADAVSSRSARHREIGLEKMREAGAPSTSVEMVLFELLRSADHPQAKKIFGIVK